MPKFTPMRTPDGLDDFTRGYMEAAEWTDCGDDNEEMLDADEFAPEFVARAKKDCADFVAANAALLERYQEVTGRDMASAGTDFWLTRNGHGAGFWDRGNDPCLTALTEASKVYREVCLYVGDDGLIYALRQRASPSSAR